MRKIYQFLIFASFVFLSSCSKENNNSEEIIAPEDKFETIDYTSKIYANGINLVRRYNATDYSFLIYGEFDNENPTFVKNITQIVFEDESKNLIFSFNRNSDLTTLYSQNINTGDINNQLFFTKDNGRFYVAEKNDDISEISNDPISERITFEGGDKITSELNLLFAKNEVYFNHLLNLEDSESKSNSVKQGKIERASIAPVIIYGALGVAAIIKLIQNGGIKKITKGTVIESETPSELIDNIIEQCSSDLNESRIQKVNNFNVNNITLSNSYSSYSCSSNPELDKKRKESSNLTPSICEGTRICLIDCNNVEDGSAYFDDCSICVGGDTGKEECKIDCNGDLNGSAYLDDCDICVGGATGLEECKEDCNGDLGGSAYLSECDICVGGSTGKTEEEECKENPLVGNWEAIVVDGINVGETIFEYDERCSDIKRSSSKTIKTTISFTETSFIREDIVQCFVYYYKLYEGGEDNQPCDSFEIDKIEEVDWCTDKFTLEYEVISDNLIRAKYSDGETGLTSYRLVNNNRLELDTSLDGKTILIRK